MMIDYASYTQDKNFIRTTLVPMAEGILTFYDKHYERDGEGTIRMAPAQAMETWQDVINPLPDVAGLRYVMAGVARGGGGPWRERQADAQQLQQPVRPRASQAQNVQKPP